MDLSAEGRGLGQSIYDIENNFVFHYASDIEIKLPVAYEGLKIIYLNKSTKSQEIIAICFGGLLGGGSVKNNIRNTTLRVN